MSYENKQYFIATWPRTPSEDEAEEAKKKISRIDSTIELVANVHIPGNEQHMWLSRPDDSDNYRLFQQERNQEAVEIVEGMLVNQL